MVTLTEDRETQKDESGEWTEETLYLLVRVEQDRETQKDGPGMDRGTFILRVFKPIYSA